MYKLIEIVKEASNDKESQAIYSFDDYTEAKAEFETKVGANMKSDAYSAFTVVVLDDIGKVTDIKHLGDAVKPRLIEINNTTEIVTPYDTLTLTEANFHSKWGSAMKNSEITTEMLRGIDGLGGEICYIYWVRPVEASEPIPEPEEE